MQSLSHLADFDKAETSRLSALECKKRTPGPQLQTRDGEFNPDSVLWMGNLVRQFVRLYHETTIVVTEFCIIEALH
jgi:hypothetical protein